MEDSKLYTKCPHCGAILALPEEFQNDKQLHCSKCDRNFENTHDQQEAAQVQYSNKNSQNAANGQSNSVRKKRKRKRGSKEMGIKGKIITTITLLILILWWQRYSQGNIKTDGHTIYTITQDIYAPTTEEAAKNYIHSAIDNQNDPVGQFEYMYNNSNSMTHMFQGDRVVVVKETSSGYKIRRLSDYQTAIVPNEKYLEQE